ncbi:hypothetical protein SAMD00019534_093140, partial [Acytostelium subglobosum LB1]|uniref:hypothetical protein n=1 Tax=Acytostelium subglobosum LB1 TaxID=1410327 RepID=UPI000644DB58
REIYNTMSDTMEKQLPVVSFESKDDSKKYRSKKRKERKIRKEKGQVVKRVQKREYQSSSEDESGEDDDNDEFEDDNVEGGGQVNGDDNDAAVEGNIKKKKRQEVAPPVEQSKEERFSSVLSSILNKQPKKDAPILAKYKKADQQIAEEQKHERLAKQKAIEKRILETKDHRTIEILITNSERDLMKTAKRGVIKLFNAVSKHQRDTTTVELDDKPNIVSKNQFLDKLKSTKKEPSVKVEVKSERDDDDEGGEGWDALKEDYMLDDNAFEAYNDEDDDNE